MRQVTSFRVNHKKVGDTFINKVLEDRSATSIGRAIRNLKRNYGIERMEDETARYEYKSLGKILSDLRVRCKKELPFHEDFEKSKKWAEANGYFLDWKNPWDTNIKRQQLIKEGMVVLDDLPQIKSLKIFHEVLEKMQFITTIKNEVKKLSKKTRSERNKTRTLIGEDLINELLEYKGNKLAPLLFKLCMATGRRPTEIMLTGRFKRIAGDSKHMLFKGQLKNGIINEDSYYKIPVLITPYAIGKGIKEIRKGRSFKDNRQCRNYCSTAINSFSIKSAYGLTPKDLRAAWAKKVVRDTYGIEANFDEYACDLLGHSEQDNTKAYAHVLIVDKHDRTQIRVKPAVEQLGRKNVKNKTERKSIVIPELDIPAKKRGLKRVYEGLKQLAEKGVITEITIYSLRKHFNCNANVAKELASMLEAL